jgi:WD40 repeat protein
MRALVILLLCFALSDAAGAQEQAKGFLGAQLQDVTKQEAGALGWKSPHGAKLVKPVPGGPAEKAGLLPDDILLSLDGVEVENTAGFIAAVGGKRPNTEIKLRLLRGGKEKRLAVTLGARPVEQTRAEPKDVPILQLDTGGHMAKFGGIAFTPDGRQLVSASEDKTIRVWDLESGKTVRTIRGESAPGDAGKVYAMALSPDGKWLAAGGWTHPECPGRCGEIRLYEFASGRLVALLKGHVDVVLALAFSADGSRLISGQGGQNAFAILWDTGIRAGARVTEPKLLHRLEGHRGDICAVGFSPDGSRAVTGSYDHDLRLWRVADGKEIARMTGHGDMVQSLAVAPDGTIASGDWSGEIRLWDARDGRFLRALARQGTVVGSLSFSPDGKLLLSGTGGTANHHVFMWDVVKGKEIVTYTGHDNIVAATAFSPDGRWAATGGGNNQEIHLWDPHSGKPRPGPDGKPFRLAGRGQTVWAAGFSADGQRIGWGNAWRQSSPVNRGPLEQGLTLPLGQGALGALIAVGEAEAGAFRRAQGSFGGFSLSHRKGGAYGGDAILDISKDGRVVASVARDATNGFAHRSYSFTPDGETVISGGSNGVLTAYGRAGNKLGHFVGHQGDVWAVAPSPDGRFLVSGSADQTVRLWNLKTRELLVTLFRGADGEWVMWTPQGYYAGSPGADKIVGWQINRGAENAADYVTAEQLRKHLNRPDIVAKAIQLASAEEAVHTSYGTQFKLSDLLARPAPHLRILSPAPDSTVTAAGSVAVKIALDATPDPVARIRIQVNGRQLDDMLPENGPKFGPGEQEFSVPLAKGKNTIVITALNEIGWSKVQDGTLSLTNAIEGALDKRGTLYLLAIGVSKYPGIAALCQPKPNCDLAYTGADAIAFADNMESKLGALHEKVVRRVLVDGGKSDGAPTAANIVNALGLLSRAQPNDTVAVFLAGHGMNDGPNYRFLSTDAAMGDGMILPATVVPWYAIEEAVDGAKGRRLLFIDTCHSASAYNQRLGNAAYYANILAYSSARWDQEALESSALGHGLFTHALVEGLGGAADTAKSGRVDTVQLSDYLQRRVPELAKPFQREQNPQVFKGRDALDYHPWASSCMAVAAFGRILRLNERFNSPKTLSWLTSVW